MTEKHLCVWPAVQHVSQRLHNSAQCSFVSTFNVICVALLVMPVACDAVDLSPFPFPTPRITDENSVLPKLTSVIWESIALKKKRKKSSQNSQKASEEAFLKEKLNNLEIFISYFVYGSYFL